jgi:DNA repair photolyase
MAPILPGLSDRPEQLRAVVAAAREAGARGIWANVVFLKPGTREHFLEALAEHWPEEVERYEELFAGREYLPQAVANPVRDEVRAAADATPFRPRGRPRTRVPAPKQPTQLQLAV